MDLWGAWGLLSPLCGLNLRCLVCSPLRLLARSPSWLVGFSLLSNVVSFPCPSHLDPNTTLLLGLYLSPALTPWLLYVEATPVVLAVVVAVTVIGSDVHRGVVVAMDVLVRGACGISMSCRGMCVVGCCAWS